MAVRGELKVVWSREVGLGSESPGHRAAERQLRLLGQVSGLWEHGGRSSWRELCRAAEEGKLELRFFSFWGEGEN